MTIFTSTLENAQSKLIRAALICTLGIIVSLAGGLSVNAHPTFSCNKTYSKAERTICKHSDLGRLDRQMSKEYNFRYRQLSRYEKRILKNDQRQWLKIRNRCGSSRNCIAGAYYDRIEALVEWDL